MGEFTVRTQHRNDAFDVHAMQYNAIISTLLTVVSWGDFATVMISSSRVIVLCGMIGCAFHGQLQ